MPNRVTMADFSEAHIQGRMAYWKGESLCMNPFQDGSELFDSWDDGFFAAATEDEIFENKTYML